MIQLKVLHGVPIYWALYNGGFYLSPHDLLNVSSSQIHEISQWCARHGRDADVLDMFWKLGRRIDIQSFNPEELSPALEAFDLSEHDQYQIRRAIQQFWDSLNVQNVEEKKPRKNARSGYVYVIEGGGYFKIGATQDLNARLKYFETKLPFEVKEVTTIPSSDCYDLERQIHEQFALKRVNGEWFNLCPEDLEKIQGIRHSIMQPA